jgi:hypothetical protein
VYHGHLGEQPVVLQLHSQFIRKFLSHFPQKQDSLCMCTLRVEYGEHWQWFDLSMYGNFSGFNQHPNFWLASILVIPL